MPRMARRASFVASSSAGVGRRATSRSLGSGGRGGAAAAAKSSKPGGGSADVATGGASAAGARAAAGAVDGRGCDALSPPCAALVDEDLPLRGRISAYSSAVNTLDSTGCKGSAAAECGRSGGGRRRSVGVYGRGGSFFDGDRGPTRSRKCGAELSASKDVEECRSVASALRLRRKRLACWSGADSGRLVPKSCGEDR